jgi:Leucine-rich repeat (LRR) protein
VEERLRAIGSQGSKGQKKDVDFMRWDLAISNLPELKDMQVWRPEKLTKLSLQNCRLTEFHVGTLTNLEELDLSHNQISELLGSGVEQLQLVQKISFSHNKIVNKKQLAVFEFPARLRSLHLEGNRDQQKDLSNYRSLVIYITRNLKGTNRCTGLLDLDGSPISLEERINAVTEHGKKKTDGQLHRWNLALMDYYGHQQMRTPNFLSHIRHLKLPNTNLSVIDLRGLFSLEVIDLSGNALITLDGLKELPK